MSSSEVLDLVGSLVWPTIVLVALLIFETAGLRIE